ncbi:hypothetical protein H9657_13300 [Cellulomonas sp. Sa3CUA2]|uniref:Oligosaccharide repeat unit polymerase n=1 Tax=Cellulomonas avistercoris TaxID=2762242 RepID=A0ABR8QFN9_9CELL|nr:hypothetical protein [Cellulomonas avistercoris]MBD7919247.1 hypothetical protein [Cellulomonas avistercoris]
MVASGAVLCGLVPLLAVVQTADVGRSGGWVVTLAVLLWAGARLSWLLGRGDARPFTFMLWLFVYIFFGLAATVQIRSGLVPTTTRDMPVRIDLPVALLVLGTLVAIDLGGLLAGVRSAGGPTRTRPGRVVSPRAALAVAAVGLACWALYLSRVGLAASFRSRHERQAARAEQFADASGAALLSALAWAPLLVAAGAFVWVHRARVRDGVRSRWAWLAVVAVLCVLMVVNPVSGARFTSGTVLFAIVSFTGVLERRRWVRSVQASVLAAFVLLFPVADAFRREEVDVSRAGFFAEYQGNGDYDAFWQVGNALLYVEDQGLTYGRQLLGVMLFWVPRSLWSGKPQGTGVLLAEHRGYGFTNLSAPLWAEAYVNGGVLLTVVAMLGVGYAVRRLDARLPAAWSEGGVLAVAVAVFPAYMIILLRGSLLQAAGLAVVMLASLWAVGRPALRPPNGHTRVEGEKGVRKP